MLVTVRWLIALLSVLYPFGVYWGLQHSLIAPLIGVLATVLILRWWVSDDHTERLMMSAMGLALLLSYAVFSESVMVKLYPLIMNLGLLLLFANSLRAHNMPLIEKVARIKTADLPLPALHYTRQVTKLWCGFFSANGLISLMTVIWGSETDWLWYNGVICYLLMASLMLFEWLYRQRLRATI